MIQVYATPGSEEGEHCKQFLEEHQFPHGYVVYDPLDEEFEERRAEVVKWSGQSAQTDFPFVFVGTTYLGGVTELLQAHESGYLVELGVLPDEGL